MNCSFELDPGLLLWPSSRLGPFSSWPTRLCKCSRTAPLSLFLPVSTPLVGCHQLAACSFNCVDSWWNRLPYFIPVSLSCLWLGSALLGCSGRYPSVLFPGKFLSTSLMYSYMLCSHMFLLHDFPLCNFSFFPASVPQQIALIRLLVRIMSASLR